MLFNTIEFFVFFPVVTVAYFLTPQRWRWLLLLAASCYFYIQFIPVYIFILFFTIAVDYVAGILIEGSQGEKRRIYLIASLIANLGVLAVFKYFNFLNNNLDAVIEFLGWNYPIKPLAIILPIGLSFHTFQSMSYTIEVYRHRQAAERHLGIFALYVMFYPQLVAGPIERPQNMLHQYHEEHHFDYQRVTDGLKLMTWGLFKKVVIADRLALVVNRVYSQPAGYEGIHLMIATVCFAYQIYCDFSGYSDIAIGAAQVMGFHFMDNFRQPYASRSISEFWRRWHISLSTWFRDYVLFSLPGNRESKWRMQLNVLLTFLASGLWHGANWTFVIWGALHGIYLLVSLWTQGLRDKIYGPTRLGRFPFITGTLQTAGTFSLVTFAWIFFRAPTVSEALYIIGHLLSGLGNFILNLYNFEYVRATMFKLGFHWEDWLLVLSSIAVLEVVQYFQRRGSVREMLARKPAWMRWSAYYGLMVAILIFGVFNRSQFIYFQF
jgi:alginate O-acetyltransferase complex protein AlgI